MAWTVSATASCRASAPAVVGMTQRGYGTKMGGRWVEHGLKIGYIRDTVIRNDSTCWDDLNIYIYFNHTMGRHHNDASTTLPETMLGKGV